MTFKHLRGAGVVHVVVCANFLYGEKVHVNLKVVQGFNCFGDVLPLNVPSPTLEHGVAIEMRLDLVRLCVMHGSGFRRALATRSNR